MGIKIKVAEANGNFLKWADPTERVLLSKDLQDPQELVLKLSRERNILDKRKNSAKALRWEITVQRAIKMPLLAGVTSERTEIVGVEL